uniref:Proteasome subunit beta n=1 Tax=Cuerna arida TaxID=1464854 RepID=A0A1B6EQR0_9HEMI
MISHMGEFRGADSDYVGPKKAEGFSPYDDNGGTTVAIAGPDFCVIASDTRLGTGYSILTREQPKLFRLSSTTVLGSSGCWCDTLSLSRLLEARLQMYLHEHNKPMATPAVAQMMSTVMYNKRFFPYYVSNILAGLDNEGKGAVYSYDPIGHYARSDYRASGNSGALLQSLLDNQIGFKNMEGVIPTPPTLEKALVLIKDAFISAAEREIATGDAIRINIITKDGIREETFPLRKD